MVTIFPRASHSYTFPYSLLCIRMRAKNPLMTLELVPFLRSSVFYTAVFTLLAT